MKLKLYKTQDSENTINKNLVFVSEFDIKLRSDFDSTYPTIKLKVSNISSKDFNYLELVELSKKYLVKKATYLANGILEIQCEIDVLETYKNGILNVDCFYSRNYTGTEFFEMSFNKSKNFEQTILNSEYEFDYEESVIITTMGV